MATQKVPAGTPHRTRGGATVVFTIILVALVSGESHSHGPQEYCENDSFHAECAEDEVVVMRSAEYGRMRLSKCIDRDYGYVGCAANVLLHADRKCSGRRQCEIRVPDPDFSDDIDCPRDLKPYLAVAYDCVKVENPRHRTCTAPQAVSLNSQSGYLASILTAETGIGSADCPWLLTAPHGQRLNITLHDFGIANPRLKPDACHAYVILREREPARRDTICSGSERVRTIYISASHQVEVRVLKAQNVDRRRHFLLHYAVIGCPDIEPTRRTWVKRDDDKTILIGCKGSDTSWRLRCDGNKWVGKASNCSQVTMGAVHGEEWGIVSLPFGLSVIIVVTIALTIGVIFMIIGLACLRWRRRRDANQVTTAHQKQSPYYTGFLDSSDQSTGAKAADRRHAHRELPWPPPPTRSGDPESIYTSENEYSYIAEVPLPPPPPPVVSTTHAHNGNEFPEPPKYFVLEPNGTESVMANHTTPSERYVANMENHVTNSLNSRRLPGNTPLEADMFVNRNESRKNQNAVRKFNDFPFREQRVDERANNHVSI